MLPSVWRKNPPITEHPHIPVLAREVVAWLDLEPGMTYGSVAFAKPIRLFFRAIVRPERVIERSYSQEPFFVSGVRYQGSVTPVFEKHLYGPVAQGLLRTANVIRLLQNGSVRLYLAYVLATLVFLLMLAR